MDNPTQEPVAEGETPPQANLLASTGDNPNAQVNVSREPLEVKATTTEQPTSLKDYFVRYYASDGVLIQDVIRC